MQVLATVSRNGVVESVHHGSAVVIRADGTIGVSVGVIDQPIYGRSSNKPFQGVAMVELGLGLEDEQLAIAVASHSAEPFHLDEVNAILRDCGLGADDLQCIVDPPYSPEAARALYASGGSPSRLTMNCSGKHAAMLATCVHCDWPVTTYRSMEHPLTVHISDVMERLTGERPAHIGIDGCGAPAHMLSLTALARGMRSIALGAHASAERKVADAMVAFPAYVGGTGRDDTILMPRVQGLFCKEGAEGVHVGALKDGTSFAFKIADGNGRARIPIAVRLLELAAVDVSEIEDLRTRPVLGGGQPVGEIRCSL
jgi:L-asparaginase II